jgi:hypothetical protein
VRARSGALTKSAFARAALQPGCARGMQLGVFATLARERACPPAAKKSASARPWGNDRKGRIPRARLPGAQLGRLGRVGPRVSQYFDALARLGDAAQTRTHFGLAHEGQGGKHDELHHLRLARYGLGRMGRPGW